MEITTWQRVLIIAAFVTIIFALLLCFAAGSTPALGLEPATDGETPGPEAGPSIEDGALSGKLDETGDPLLLEPAPAPDPDEYEPDNAKHQASPIRVGDPQVHSFQSFDEDWVKFWAWAGNSYTIRTFDLDYGCDTELCLRNAAGTEIPGVPCDDNGGDEERASKIDWRPDESGAYFVRVSPHNPSVSGNLSYTLVISEVVGCRDRLEPDDTYEDAKPIADDSHTFHGPCGGDVDWASFEAVGGVVYEIWTSNLRGNNDTVLGLHDSSGLTVTLEGEHVANDDYAEGIPASQIVWQAPADGTYVVKVSPFEPGAGGCDLEYVLHIDTLPAMPTPTPSPTPPAYEPDDYEPDDGMHQARRIEVNGAPQDHAFHSYQDQDWGKFWAWAGYTYTIRTEAGLGTATQLDLYSADGQRVPVEDEGDPHSAASRIDWKATGTGSYFVKVTYPDEGVRQLSLASPHGLTYSLAVSETIPCREVAYEPDDTPDQAKPITVGGDAQRRCFFVPCFDGYAAPDTADWVQFEAQAGIAYEIRTFNLTGRTDTVLTLYSADPGTAVTVNDDYADDGLASRIVWEAAADGTCYVKVSPFDPRVGGCDVCYSLEVKRLPGHVYLPLVLKPPNFPPRSPANATPAPGATDQPLDVDLGWSGGDPDWDDQVFYDIYLGTKSPPTLTETIGPYPASQTAITYDPGPLQGGRLYRWFVVARDDRGAESRGPEEGWWDFTTCACPDEREPDDEIEHANPLEPGEPVRGYICQEHVEDSDGEERDWYSFELDRPYDVEVDLEVPDTVNYDLAVWVGERQGSRCIPHWQGSEDLTPGGDEHVSWSAECVGKHYAVVKSLGDYDNCVPYTLRVTLK